MVQVVWEDRAEEVGMEIQMAMPAPPEGQVLQRWVGPIAVAAAKSKSARPKSFFNIRPKNRFLKNRCKND